MQDPCKLVRQSARWVYSESKPQGRVRLFDTAMYELVESMSSQEIDELYTPQKHFDTTLHFTSKDGDAEKVLLYLLTVDAINFCFWPDEELQYEHIAGGIKSSLAVNPRCLDPTVLKTILPDGVADLIGWPRPLPQAEERARLLREIGTVLSTEFEGSALSLVAAAGGSAVRLVSILTMHFPGFRDAAVYRGRQAFFYKRAQIFAADVYGAFSGQGPGNFHDIDQLTCFPDYRLPQILRALNIMEYGAKLAAKIDAKLQLCAGSEEEIEIRAATIVAVERLREMVMEKARCRKGAALPHAVHVDWWLWELGESRRDQSQHHRVLTVYY